MDKVASSSLLLQTTLKDVSDKQERKTIILDFLQLARKFSVTLPNFKKDHEWFNTSEPLSYPENLQGKICILDFFTYCCINCMHILPDLEALEKKFTPEQGVVVVGVHSAKFENEKVSANIQSAIQRYNIRHAVVNDAEAELWHLLNIQCWPTLVVVDPWANILFMLAGEGHRDLLLEFVGVMLEYYQSKSMISYTSLPVGGECHTATTSLLSFPGKVCIDETGTRIAVSDTAHHRVLVLNTQGVIQMTIGGMEPGFCNGTFTDCRLHSPQGVCFYGQNILFVADTDNHAVRQIDLEAEMVTTLCGTGQQGNDLKGGSIGVNQPISSPWDLVISRLPGCPEDVLLIAIAGTHQIWVSFLKDSTFNNGRHFEKGTCLAFAGCGEEENRNNRYAHKASFAQPSGLALAKMKSKQAHNTCFIAFSLEGPAAIKIPLVSAQPASLSSVPRAPPPPTLPGAHAQPSIPDPHPPPVPGAPPPPPPLFPCAPLPPPNQGAPPPPPIPGATAHRFIPEAPALPSVHGTPAPPPPPVPPSHTVPGTSGNSDFENVLYIADSESSSVRLLSLATGAVSAVVGARVDPTDLFAFGDNDGQGTEARLQHPLGVAVRTTPENKYTVLVADSYNHKVKIIHPDSKTCITLLGNGHPGNQVGADASQVMLNEPGGICVHPNGQQLYIADTNNHAIKVYNFDTHTTSELKIVEKVPPVDVADAVTFIEPVKLQRNTADIVDQKQVYVCAGGSLQVLVELHLADGLHYTQGAPSQWMMWPKDIADMLIPSTPHKGHLTEGSSSYTFVLEGPNEITTSGALQLELHHKVYYCDDVGLCKMKTLIFLLSVMVTEEEKSPDPFVIKFSLT